MEIIAEWSPYTYVNTQVFSLLFYPPVLLRRRNDREAYWSLSCQLCHNCHREKFFRSPLASHLSFPSPKMQQQFWREKLHTTISNLAISSLSYLRTLEWMPCSPSNLLLLILSVCFITPFTANFRHNCWVSNKKEFQWKNLPDFSTVNTDE